MSVTSVIRSILCEATFKDASWADERELDQAKKRLRRALDQADLPGKSSGTRRSVGFGGGGYTNLTVEGQRLRLDFSSVTFSTKSRDEIAQQDAELRKRIEHVLAGLKLKILQVTAPSGLIDYVVMEK